MNTEKIKSRESNVESPEPESSGGPVIRFPSEAEEKRLMEDSLRRMRDVRHEQGEAARSALPALKRLIEVMRHKTGQGYKLREFLHSMWSGTATADLCSVVSLDWEIRKDLGRVLLAWGFPGSKHQGEFFYTQLEEALSAAGLLEWFRKDGGES